MKVRSWVLGVAGGLLLLASVAHSLGWSQFDAALAGVDAKATGGLRVGWIWGSFAFAAYGLILLGAAVGWRRHGRDPRWAAGPVALAFVVFGLWALLYRGVNPHFLFFVAVGLLVGAPLLGRVEPG